MLYVENCKQIDEWVVKNYVEYIDLPGEYYLFRTPVNLTGNNIGVLPAGNYKDFNTGKKGRHAELTLVGGEILVFTKSGAVYDAQRKLTRIVKCGVANTFGEVING